MKGRQLGFLLLLCSGWAVARLTMLSGDPVAAPLSPYVAVQDEAVIATPHTAVPIAHTASVKIGAWKHNLSRSSFPPDWAPRSPKRVKSPPVFAATPQTNGSKPAQPQLMIHASMPQPAPMGMVPPRANPTKHFAEIYAYSYWRWDSKDSGLAAAGQYGGSQSGIIVAVPLRGIGLSGNDEKLALMFRATASPDNRADREVALGLRLRPVGNLPVTITAERRFRPVGPDRVAGYIAGGVDEIALPGKFTLDSYAQGGVVSGPDAGEFFDASARVHRPLHQKGALSLKAGGGAWAGGQTGTSRLDIGPSLSADVALGSTRLRINADWRFRVAGNAEPGDGPALTLSTSI